MRRGRLTLGITATGVFATLVLWVSATGAQEQPAKAALPAADTEQKLFVLIETMLKTEPEQGNSEKESFENYKKHLGEITTRCQEYLTKYPAGASNLAVRGYQVHIGFVLANMNNDKPGMEKAAQEIEKLIAAHPGVEAIERLRATLGQYYAETGQFDKAIAHLRKLQETTKDEDAARAIMVFICEIQEQTGDTKAAMESLKLLIAKYPEAEEATFAKKELVRLEQIGKPFALSFTSVDGKKVAISDYAGKVVLVDCWATWCGPCRSTMPEMVKLNADKSKDGLVILGISLDKDKQAMLDFEKTMGMTWPQYFDGKVWQNDIAKQLGVESIPATYLVDKKGVLRAMDLRGETLAKRVDELLKEGKN